MSIVEQIAKSNYIASLEAVEALAREHADARDAAEGTGATYLSILIAMTQKAVKEGRRRRANALDELNVVHESLYDAVLKGTGGSQPKATFARTAKSTLASYLKAGKSLTALTPGQTSKASLRAAVAPAEPQDRTERTLFRASTQLERVFKRMARKDREHAVQELSALIDKLQAQLDEIEQEEPVAVTNHSLQKQPAKSGGQNQLHA